MTPKTTPPATAPHPSPRTTWEADSPLVCISGLRRPKADSSGSSNRSVRWASLPLLRKERVLGLGIARLKQRCHGQSSTARTPTIPFRIQSLVQTKMRSTKEPATEHNARKEVNIFWNASFFVLLEVACAALPKQEGDIDAAVLVAGFEMKTICLVEKVYDNRHARTRVPITTSTINKRTCTHALYIIALYIFALHDQNLSLETQHTMRL